MPRSRTPTIFVVSDGTGHTGRQLLNAALVQFEGQHHQVSHHPEVRTAKRVRQLVARAAKTDSVIVYTLVGDETRCVMSEAAERLLVPTVDVLGPLFSGLHTLFKQAPTATPGLLYASDRESFDRHAAIDYTLKHDDGQRPDELDQADVVLVGVSRTSKSSTCFYLAYRGIKAANVPLVPHVAPPPALLELDPQKVIGLRINVMRLMIVREVRAAHMGLTLSDEYLDKHAIAREVIEANRMMDKHGWRSFDASYMAIEEIAREVLTLRGQLTAPFGL